MEGIDPTRSTSDLELGWRRGKHVVFIAWWTEVAAQRTRNEGGVEGDHQ
jgi:hypothetical protein